MKLNSKSDLTSPVGTPIELTRRNLLVAAAGLSVVPLLEHQASSLQPAAALETTALASSAIGTQEKSVIGQYGSWVSGLVNEPPKLSFRNDSFPTIESWRAIAHGKTSELIAAPQPLQITGIERIGEVEQVGQLDIEHLRWQLPYGRATEAVLLKPHGATGPLPGVLALHDHGGNKYFGYRKITQTQATQHPLVTQHQRHDYDGLAWANELASRGYVVLVHDTFAFGSRRVLYQDVADIAWGACKTSDKSDANPEAIENIERYNQWASEHENIMAKSLFCSGTTWPGMFLVEDQAALSVLANRPEVDAERLGCGGLSGGGLRTVFLGGLDPRIRCAVCVGFMTTWKDFLLRKSYTHTWMSFAPLLPQYLDFPEILGLRAPLPTMVQNCSDDELYTPAEMQRADEILQSVYAKANATERYSGRFYPGGHQFNRPMQQDAFAWFDSWLS